MNTHRPIRSLTRIAAIAVAAVTITVPALAGDRPGTVSGNTAESRRYGTVGDRNASRNLVQPSRVFTPRRSTDLAGRRARLGLAAQAPSEEIKALRLEIEKTYEKLRKIREERERLARQQEAVKMAKQRDEWTTERSRYQAERKAYLRELQRVEKAREQLTHTVKLEADRAEKVENEAHQQRLAGARTNPKVVSDEFAGRYGIPGRHATYHGSYRLPLHVPYLYSPYYTVGFGLGPGLHSFTTVRQLRPVPLRPVAPHAPANTTIKVNPPILQSPTRVVPGVPAPGSAGHK